jgi:hypothetical protein
LSMRLLSSWYVSFSAGIPAIVDPAMVQFSSLAKRYCNQLARNLFKRLARFGFCRI